MDSKVGEQRNRKGTSARANRPPRVGNDRKSRTSRLPRHGARTRQNRLRPPHAIPCACKEGWLAGRAGLHAPLLGSAPGPQHVMTARCACSAAPSARSMGAPGSARGRCQTFARPGSGPPRQALVRCTQTTRPAERLCEGCVRPVADVGGSVCGLRRSRHSGHSVTQIRCSCPSWRRLTCTMGSRAPSSV